MPIKSMDFPVWLGARRRHSELWQRRATTPDGESHDLIGMFFTGNHLISTGRVTPFPAVPPSDLLARNANTKPHPFFERHLCTAGCSKTFRDSIQDDGQQYDGKSGLKAQTNIESLNSRQNVVSKATRPYHRSNNHH